MDDIKRAQDIQASHRGLSNNVRGRDLSEWLFSGNTGQLPKISSTPLFLDRSLGGVTPAANDLVDTSGDSSSAVWRVAHLPDGKGEPKQSILTSRVKGLGERLYNAVTTGNFWTNEQMDHWGNGLIAANHLGTTADYLRKNPTYGATGVAATTGLGAGMNVLKAAGTEDGFMQALKAAEGGAVNGHTVARHVKIPVPQLKARLSAPKAPSASSTFTNATTAGHSIMDALAQNRAAIKAWKAGQAGSPSKLVVTSKGSDPIGFGFEKGSQTMKPATNAKVVLKRLPSGGFAIVTAYPAVK